jgi:hypothetical protein
MVDGRTIADEDLNEVQWLLGDSTSALANFQLTFSDQQKWYYLSEQGPDEVSMLKNYDSADVPSSRMNSLRAF